MGILEDRTGSPLSGLWFVIALVTVGAVVSLALRPRASVEELSTTEARA